jgi:PAS domain S-box-containing protein
MAQRIQANDWSGSPLGAPSDWPQSLRSVVGLMLASRFPMFVAWGPDLGFVYNDAYAAILGAKHPEALGRRFEDVWGEIWSDVGPLAERALAGEAVWLEDLPLTMRRHGYDEQTWFTFSYSPVRDESGAVAGVYCACTETTGKVLAERRLAAEAERQRRLFQQAPGFVAILRGPDHVFEYANDAYVRLLGDRDFIGRTVREALPEIEGQGFFEWLDKVYATGDRIVAHHVPVAVVRTPGEPPEQRYVDFIYAPVTDENGRVTGIFCEGHDVTEAHRERIERARAEAELRASQQEFELLTDALPVLVSYLGVDDGDVRYRFVNKIYETWFSRSRDDIRGMRVRDVVGEDAYEKLKPRIDRALAGERVSFEQFMPYLNAGPRHVRVEYVPRAGADGTVEGVYALILDVTAAKEAEAALRASEMLFRLIADSSPALIWMSDADGKVVFANRRYEEVFGRPADDMNGDGWRQIVHPDDLERHSSSFQAAFDARERFRTVTRVIDRTGAMLWLHCEGVPRYEADGAFAGYVGVNLDISDAKRAEAALRDNEERLGNAEARLRFALDAAGMAVWDYDVATDTIAGSSELNRLLGLPEDHPFDTAAFRASYHPGDEDRIREAAQAAFARGEHGFGAEFRHRGGGAVRWFMLRARIVVQPDGTVAKITGVVADITAQKETEERLRESEATVRAFFETANLYKAVVELGADDFRFVTANGQMARILQRDELIGRRASEVFGPEIAGAMTVRLRDAHAAGHPTTVEYPYASGGEVRWFVATLSPMPAGASGDPRISVASLDITDRKRAEAELRQLNETLELRVIEAVAEREQAQEALRQSQKLEAIGQLTGGVAHDFNNLLTVIRSSADLLRRPDLPESRRQRYVEAIADTADRAAKLTGQLLAFARRQALKPEVFEVGDRVRGVGEMLRTVVGSRIRIATEIDCDDCYVEADVNQFETAILNMAVNARDAMDGEGVLTIAIATEAHVPQTRGHAAVDGDFVAVAISDTGAGIDPDKLARIFEPFFTTKEVGKGTGLGLSQVFGFAKQSGGEVTVDSAPGKGATFTLYLPRVEAPPHQPESGQATVDEAAPRGHVLVVEDNEQVGSFSTQLMAELGYETSWAPDAQAALRLLEEDAGRYVAVFSDVVMPGMNGVELGREIRRRWPGLPVVLTSGYSHVLAEEGRHGFDLLHKPYSVEGLTTALRKAIHRE